MASSPSRSLDRPLNNILVLGATGNIGIPIIHALASHPYPYTITALTRSASKIAPSTFPPNTKILSSDYTPASLRPLFLKTDAVISCLAVPLLFHQKTLIDLAIECSVARFMPSEFGMNTTHPLAPSILPLIQPKIEIQNYLAASAAEGKIGYTTIYNGAFFDWFFRFPDAMGWDVTSTPPRATIYDGGDVAYEVTTVSRIGEAVAAALSPEHAVETRDQRVFINSFTLTQNELLPVLEKAVGRKFELGYDETEGLIKRVPKTEEIGGGEKAIAAALLTACLGGEGGLNLFSRDSGVGGLWNERLGLKDEDLGECVMEVIAAGAKSGMPGS